MLERSDRLRRSTLLASCAALSAALIAGCGFPDQYSFDLDKDASAAGSGGNAGAAGADAADVSIENVAGSSGSAGSGGSVPDSSDSPDDQPVNETGPDTADTEPPDALETGPEVDAADGADASDTSDALDAVAEEAAPPIDTGTEDCTNGTDDDNDGKADCQDTDCTPYFMCVTPPPTGWLGHFELYEGVPASMPACAAPFSTLAVVAGRDPSFQPATCSQCSCGSPTSVTCSDAKLVIWENDTCDSSTGWGNFTYQSYGTCAGWNLNPGDAGTGVPSAASWITPPQAQAGTGFCSPSIVQATLPSVNWSTVGAACQVDQPGAGCPGQNVCVPKPSGSFKSGVCIYKAGVNNCPTGPYFNKYVFYQEYADSRGCDSCTCGSPTGVTCNATITIASNNTCAGAAIEAVVSDSTCHDIPSTTTHYLKYDQLPTTGGGCTSAGGQPNGTVTNNVNTAYTFCCTI